MTQTINRRQAIAGTVAGLATIPMTASPVAAMADNDPDVELIGLYHEYRLSFDAYKDALKVVWKAEEAVVREQPEPDECIIHHYTNGTKEKVYNRFGNPKIMSQADIHSLWEGSQKYHSKGSDHLRDTRLAALNDWKAKRKAVKARHNIEGLEKQANDIGDQNLEIAREISKVPAKGLTGIAIKLTIWCGGDCMDEGGIDGLPYGATRDALRLSGLPEITG